MILPKLIIFDMAGTTVRDQKEVETCFQIAAENTGLKMSPEEITAVQGWSKLFVFQTYWTRQGKIENLDSATIDQNIQYSYGVFKEILENHYKNLTEIVPTEGCLALFQFLKENQIKIGLTTGFYRVVVDIILERLGWEYPDAPFKGSFKIDSSLAGDEVQEGRPAPFMIHETMKRLGIALGSDVMNIGDTPSDLESGKRARVRLSLGLTNGTHTREQLEAYPNDGLFGSLKEFHEFLKD